MGRFDVAVVGGCGHVGLPLALAFAQRGLRVAVYDISQPAVDLVNSGQMPFQEPGAPQVLADVLAQGTFMASCDPGLLSSADNIVVVIGTPIDKHLNPEALGVPQEIEKLSRYLVDGQLLVLRSTLYPGVTRMVERLLAQQGQAVDVAFCPERIAEGKAMTELFSLPQLVAGRTAEIRARAAALFSHLTQEIVELEPEEAELAKLFTNTWRYIKFATANQLYMIANDFGLDYDRIRIALAHNYPRAQDLPGAGLAAGPCLLKDTMQLAAFNNNQFTLGHSAMLINEGLPLYTVARLEQRFDLSQMTVGILGMAFKGESDDVRSSLSYRLKRILQFKSKRVLCTDPYVTTDANLTPLEVVLSEADLVVIGAPHQQYRELAISVPVVDLTNLRGKGSGV
ncbi:MAG TPA: nucleotide sugar dehydrogenase [Candidatus Nanopelagicaceae bacterium]|nr:nucleotide sugar dehydrogenase [Candidatus Nanopelagicaceae bacterium]